LCVCVCVSADPLSTGSGRAATDSHTTSRRRGSGPGSSTVALLGTRRRHLYYRSLFFLPRLVMYSDEKALGNRKGKRRRRLPRRFFRRNRERKTEREGEASNESAGRDRVAAVHIFTADVPTAAAGTHRGRDDDRTEEGAVDRDRDRGHSAARGGADAVLSGQSLELHRREGYVRQGNVQAPVLPLPRMLRQRQDVQGRVRSLPRVPVLRRRRERHRHSVCPGRGHLHPDQQEHGPVPGGPRGHGLDDSQRVRTDPNAPRAMQ